MKIKGSKVAAFEGLVLYVASLVWDTLGSRGRRTRWRGDGLGGVHGARGALRERSGLSVPA